jgi:hypothetical protein
VIDIYSDLYEIEDKAKEYAKKFGDRNVSIKELNKLWNEYMDTIDRVLGMSYIDREIEKLWRELNE